MDIQNILEEIYGEFAIPYFLWMIDHRNQWLSAGDSPNGGRSTMCHITPSGTLWIQWFDDRPCTLIKL